MGADDKTERSAPGSDFDLAMAITSAQRKAAARLRVDSDEKNGVVTPAWIKRLAQDENDAGGDATPSEEDEVPDGSLRAKAKRTGKKVGKITKVALDLWASAQ